MERFIRFTIGILAIFTVFSCRPQPDDNGYMLHGLGNSSGGGSTTNGTQALSKINTYDSNGKAVTYNFGYSNKLLTSVNWSDNTYTSTITYSADKISKVVSVFTDSTTSTTTTTTSTVTHNSSGNVSKVLSTEDLSYGGAVVSTTDKVADYTYDSAGQLIKIVQEHSVSSVPSVTVVIDFSYSGSNISKVVLTTVNSVIGQQIVVTTDYSGFDTKISPSSKLPLDFRQYSLSEQNLLYYGTGPNNPAKGVIKESFTGSSTTSNMTYEYNADGYTTSLSENGGKKITFEYISI